MNPHYQDKTTYARLCGYTGNKPVMVCDGKVVSHANRPSWDQFLGRCITRQTRRNSSAMERSEARNGA